MTKVETVEFFDNVQNVLLIRYLLQAISHPQPPVPFKTDNNSFVLAPSVTRITLVISYCLHSPSLT